MKPNALRITCVQANPTVGDLDGNFGIMRRYRQEFRGKADLLVFSECFGSGYPLGDLVLRPAFRRDFRKHLTQFCDEIASDDGPAVLLGGPHEGSTLPYNAAYLIDNDGSMQISFKHRLPNEEVYDEKRTFAEGPMPRPLTFLGFKIGVPICEDFWHGDVTRSLADEGADFFVVLNGSHFKVGKQSKRLRLGHDCVKTHGKPVVYVNQFGGQDELVFDGGSFAIDRSNNLITQIAFREGTFDLSIERGDHGIDLHRTDYMNSGAAGYPDELEATYKSKVVACRDYVRKTGFTDVVIGNSGGLDSATTAAIAVDALGPEHVHLVRLPSEYTSEDSMEHARLTAELLGTDLRTISIVPAVDAFRSMLSDEFTGLPEDVTEENIQARARALVLMALSNKFGWMLLATGNKSEISVGFMTIGGDMLGGYAILKDTWKTKVKAIAKWRNENFDDYFRGKKGPAVLEEIIKKAPTAELKDGQTDEAALGPYEELDPVLIHMVQGFNDPRRAAALASEDVGYEITVEYATKIAQKVWRAQYKRVQSPPGPVETDVDFGKGWRLPIVNQYGL